MEETLTIVYENGVEVERIDTRTLAGQKTLRISQLKADCGEQILALYPTYKQQNAALGLCDEATIQAIKDGIQELRDECDDKEAAINCCVTLAELDAI